MDSLKRGRSSSDLIGLRSRSKATFPGAPGLLLVREDGGCALYNPKEGNIQRNLAESQESGFLAISGNWLLMFDYSGCSLYLIDVFGERTIPLPSLESVCPDSESISLGTQVITRVGNKEFVRRNGRSLHRRLSSDMVKGVLWVDESGEEYVVVWLFDLLGHPYLSFCKNGDTQYTDIPLFIEGSHFLDGLFDMVLKGHTLYISTNRRYVRVFDLSGPQGFYKDLSGDKPFPMLSCYESWDSSIVVTTTEEVLLVESYPRDRKFFRVYKKNLDIKDPRASSHTVLEVNSLGGEALLLDLGFTVPANPSLGIEPDSIYFTRHYRPCECEPRDLDICVFNLATQTMKRFPDLESMDLKDARWFLHGK